MSSTKNASTPVIDWDSAPEGFPVWIEDLIPFGGSTSCWAKDAGSHFLGVNGSKWDKPSGFDFAVHHRTQSIAEIIEGADRAVFDRAYVVKDCSPVMAAALLEQFRSSMGENNRRSAVLMNPSPVDFQASINCFYPSPAEAIDWSAAPEGATHRYDELWYKFDFEANTAAFCSNHSRDWIDVSPATNYLDGSMDDMIARPTEPEEKWSLNGENGSWDYDTLAELVKDHYGHGRDGGHPLESDGGLQIGDTVYRSTLHKDDPAGFVPDEDHVIEYMSERAYESDAGEWADNYPDLNEEAKADLANALKPLEAWARKHCQPSFFTVNDITPHILTAEDVRAAQ